MFLLVALCAVEALSLALLRSDLNSGEQEWKDHPVAKVVELLKDTAAQFDEEAKNSAEVYDKIACRCTTNDKERTKDIKDDNEQISDFTAAIDTTRMRRICSQPSAP